jgi:hypothetical protein
MVDTSGMRWEVKRRRGCGYRKQGGLYLVSDGEMHGCGLLPRELTVCPCCHAGVKQKIGWTWVQARMVGLPSDIDGCGPKCDLFCGMRNLIREAERKVGLIWIGAQHYPNPEDYIREGSEMGLSRRVHAVPKGFAVGQTWVLLAHPKACPPRVDEDCTQCAGSGLIVTNRDVPHGDGPIDTKPCKPCGEKRPGIFGLFLPTRVERICVPAELEQEGFLEDLERRGITPVLVSPDDPDHMPRSRAANGEPEED